MKIKIEESGSNQASEELAATQKDIVEMKQNAENEINTQIEKAREQMKKEFEDLGAHIIEKILDRRLAS